MPQGKVAMRIAEVMEQAIFMISKTENDAWQANRCTLTIGRDSQQ
jgi:hypothetical protein